MALYTVRPNSVSTNGGGTNPSSAATVLSRLSDNSDATFVDRNTTGPVTWSFGVPNPNIASDEFPVFCTTEVRHSGGSGSDLIGAQTRRSVTPVGSVPTAAGVSAVINSVGFGDFVTWSAANLAALVLDWYTMEYGASYMRVYDLLARITTIKRSTATPQATTMSTSAVPTIPVDVANVVASGELGSNQRKVRVEVRIESGGSGAGTGILVAEKTFEFDLSSSGSYTTTMNAVFAESLSNGTYKAYARAIRFREDYPTIRADQTSAWSTAATLTMNLALPNTPTLSLVTNDALAIVTATITPSSSTGYSAPTVSLERSDDGGATWTPVRNGTQIAATFGVGTQVIDREAPRGVTAQYRARASATYTGGAVNASAWSSTQTATPAAPATWNLRAPEQPSLDVIGINIVGATPESIDEDLGIFRPIDRRYPVIVAGELSGWDGELTFDTTTEAAWQAIRALAEAQLVLLLQSAFGGQKYIRFVGGMKVTTRGTPTSPSRRASQSYVECGAP